jgi:hypothetical protein
MPDTVNSRLIIKRNLGCRFGLVDILEKGSICIMLLPLHSSSKLEEGVRNILLRCFQDIYQTNKIKLAGVYIKLEIALLEKKYLRS